MDTDALKAQLGNEGFTRVLVWRDPPRAVHPDHTHRTETAHIVLDGEVTVTTASGSHTYKTGDRFDVPAHEVHSAEVGGQGCTYLIGEK